METIDTNVININLLNQEQQYHLMKKLKVFPFIRLKIYLSVSAKNQLKINITVMKKIR